MKDFEFLKKLWCCVDAGGSEIRDQIPSGRRPKARNVSIIKILLLW